MLLQEYKGKCELKFQMAIYVGLRGNNINSLDYKENSDF